jgi:hypothetical protein
MIRASRRKYHYIYKTTCKVTGKYYYGMHSTDNLNDDYIGSGKRLWHSINKHGRENHRIEILEFFESREELRDREAQLINESLLKNPMCMNLQLGGGGGWANEEHKEKNLKAMHLAFKQKLKDPEFMEKFIIHNRNNMINNHKQGKIKYNTFSGKKHSEQTKRKIGQKNSLNQSGINNSQFGTRRITNGKENKKIKIYQLIPDGWIYGRI